jgi:hypothetical protein
MSMIWRHSLIGDSRQHWLYDERSNRILGMVYEVGPAAFTVYKEYRREQWNVNSRKFITQMETLDEAKGLLQTLVGAEV